MLKKTTSDTSTFKESNPRMLQIARGYNYRGTKWNYDGPAGDRNENTEKVMKKVMELDTNDWNADNYIRDNVTPEMLKSATAEEKAHMLKILTGGVITKADHNKINEIMHSVKDEKEMKKVCKDVKYEYIIDDIEKYKISDKKWKKNKLDNSDVFGRKTIGSKGCCVTATSIAISKIKGEKITPGDLDESLDNSGGYAKDKLVFPTNNINWKKLEDATGVKAKRKDTLDFKDIDNNLQKDKPVIIAMDYKGKNRSDRNDGIADHWITIVGKKVEGGKTYYYAVDNVKWGKADMFLLEKKKINGQTVLYRKDYRPIDRRQHDNESSDEKIYNDFVSTGSYVTFKYDKSKADKKEDVNTNTPFRYKGEMIVPDEA